MTRTEWLETVESDVPARLDRLPWVRWHWVVVCALGLTWILDGLEATIVGSVAARLTAEEALDFTTTDVGLAASVYLAGGACGAILFGWLNDRIGRRRTFLLTLSLYLLGTLATATAFSFWSFALFRFVTGLGIGGEYVAINATIGELVPARRRGWAYIAVNGSWWLGASFGAALSLLLLEPGLLPPDVGWRLAFAGGAVLGIGILLVRRHVPESPRWLLVHGRAARADALVGELEQRAGDGAGEGGDRPRTVQVRQRLGTPVATVLRTIAGDHRRRAVLALALMASQAFFYNAVFYTHGIVLTDYYGVTPDDVGLHLVPLAAANFLGAVALGALFDSWGRRPMLALTYTAAGAGLAALSFLFRADALTLLTQTIAWSAVFLFASAAASAAYLTVAEIFPVEIRGVAFALFYAISTGAGGVSGPALFGLLLGSEQRGDIFAGYLVAAALMVAAGLVALTAGVRAERRPLEEVAPPLGSHGSARQAPADVSTATMVP